MFFNFPVLPLLTSLARFFFFKPDHVGLLLYLGYLIHDYKNKIPVQKYLVLFLARQSFIL